MVLSPGFCRSDFEASSVYSKLFLKNKEVHRCATGSLGSSLGALARSRHARVWIYDTSRQPGNLRLTSGYFCLDKYNLSHTQLPSLTGAGRQNACEKSRGVGLTEVWRPWTLKMRHRQVKGNFSDTQPVRHVPSKGCGQLAGSPAIRLDRVCTALWGCFCLCLQWL